MLSYNSIKELVDAAKAEGCRISEICLKDQAKKMGSTEEQVFKSMEQCFDIMCESAEWGEQKGRKSTSGLTGDEGYLMSQYAKNGGGLMGQPMARAVSRALAVSNCNAAMGKIVATPTAGSCGILPGCLITAYEDRHLDKKDVVMSIFTAAAFGMVVAEKASIAGAQGGCQAECGSASGMAAAALVELMGGTPEMCADALAIAIANQEGLVCDPVAGLVEIPCIKRNGSGVVIAFSSADMALAGIEAKIPADECIDAMREVGDAMSRDLKETATGGLAATPTGKRYREMVFGA
ncbi:L-serine ammonia-lyase, iron-sulfur-dependent, subunit alpha [Oribacterium sp. WCC10]|uniref:L-serine ammonia-lyase, iron-sulfur-dependent, subunit alpha n=1 Tax=Oribacterium sp. WCC10 TaxID=1855343 RepID=UPI0008EEDEBC|nr:L-serine ammonia-lyase, iron-sulfur-dependent, subunit alpha [Oribacterium sp. WCC10]SFG44497.1 L-serine dehydratase [Oribacterium sp. WCC10]